MDIRVTQISASDWSLSDLLDRPLGKIDRQTTGSFSTSPAYARAALFAGVRLCGHWSLSDAVAAIKQGLKGTAHLATAQFPAVEDFGLPAMSEQSREPAVVMKRKAKFLLVASGQPPTATAPN